MSARYRPDAPRWRHTYQGEPIIERTIPMIFGRSIVHWLLVFLVAACIFFLVQWLIPQVFGLIGVNVPDQIAAILALLCALGVVYSGASWRAAP